MNRQVVQMVRALNMHAAQAHMRKTTGTPFVAAHSEMNGVFYSADCHQTITAERDAAQAARWAVKWRDLAEEALAVAESMRDPEAQRHMVFIAEAYKLLVERAKERSVRLLLA